MRIVDINRNPIRACFQFHYKGYWISVSTISKQADIAIFDQNYNHKRDLHPVSIEHAMDEVDKLSD